MRTNLREILDSRGIKQTWLANEIGMSVASINKIVNGQRTPNLETAIKIAKVLRVNVEEIWYINSGQ